VSDKEFIKIYVKAIVGNQYNVPTKAVLRDRSEVDSYEFPPSCCIKPTQASGKVILRRNCEPIEKETIKSWFDINYYYISREANYKNLKPKVIVEPLIFNNPNVEDYKFFCFNGKVKLIQVDIDRRTNHKRAIYDTDWKQLQFSIAHPKAEQGIPRPNNLFDMINIAESLSQYFDLIRIDMYSDGNQCLIGEITNCHGNASEKFIPQEAEIEASRIIFN